MTTTMAPPRSISVVDALPLAGGIFFLAAALAFRFPLWTSVAALLPHAPADFGEAFTTFRGRQQVVLFPLGVFTAIVTIVALLLQGTSSTRGRLRVLAVMSLLGTSLVSAVAVEPIAMSMVAGAAELNGQALADLAQRWSNWQWVTFGLTLTGALALVVAHRYPAPAVSSEIAGMSHQHRTLLLLLGAATLFEGYDRFIVSLALPYIGRDLGVAEGDLGYALSIIRVGALLSIFLGRIADRFGRRRVLLATVLAYTLATFATGLSTGLATFVLFQLVATIFLTAELALAQVVIAEEFPAGVRGRGQGFLGAFAALGAGVAALLFPILQASAFGWRGLYFIGILPLLLIAFLRRNMPETARWRQLQAEASARQPGLFDVFRPGLRLRFTLLMLMAATATMVAGPTFAFASYRATNAFGWTPGQVSLMMIAGGGIGLLGWFVFGRLADTAGRRFIGAAGIVMAAAGIGLYYRTPWLLPAFAMIVFAEAGVAIALNALGTELFPTGLRATAKSWITNAGIIGAMIGLGIVGAASDSLGGAHVVISLLAIAALIIGPLIFLLPETRGQELEAITPAGAAE
jgi:putative MFS transporter